MDDWSAGYTLEIGTVGAASNSWDQIIDDGVTTSALTVRKSNWWLKSGTYGKFTVGLEGTATYHLLDDADATNTRNFSDAEAAAVAQGRFLLRSNGNGVGGGAFGTGLRWSDILRGVNNGTPGQNGRRNIVRYNSPELYGFVVTASWGEDDMGGVSLTYKNVWGDFQVLGKAGFEHSSDENPASRPVPRFPVKIARGRARPPPSARADRALRLWRLRSPTRRHRSRIQPAGRSNRQNVVHPGWYRAKVLFAWNHDHLRRVSS